MAFLPVNLQEAGGSVDFVLVSADAYVDHPSFGHAVIARLLQHYGYTVGIVPQPVSDEDYKVFGRPRIGFMVSGGVVDSMVNNYTVAKIRRTADVYSEGGRFGRRPDRAVTVYTRKLKELFPDSAVAIGGVEASLRRFAHYDYWADKVMPSVLIDSGADLLIYGMGEKPVADICALLDKGVPLAAIKNVRGTCYASDYDSLPKSVKAAFREYKFCPSYEEVAADKEKYVKAFNLQSRNSDFHTASVLCQRHGAKYVIQNKPQLPLSESELDLVYSLPFERDCHPMYKDGVPAIEEVKFSITSHRGCFGGCSYCALTYHMGRIIQKRSKQSIIAEAKSFTEREDFKGYIHDVGGPTANFRNPACRKQQEHGACAGKNCIGYESCSNLEADHTEYLDILKSLRQIPKVKKVFIRSGVRYDYALMDKNPEFLHTLIKHHISGQLKVAPEHCRNNVLRLMNKPPFETYLKFSEKFYDITRKVGKEQYLVPYLISSHPGCTLNDAIELARYLKSVSYQPEQVQDFYPTPSTKSTCMYYTGINPDTMEKVYVPRDKEEKRMQRALLQYRKKTNYDIIRQALIKAGRKELIGFGPDCLIKPTGGKDAADGKPKRIHPVVTRRAKK